MSGHEREATATIAWWEPWGALVAALLGVVVLWGLWRAASTATWAPSPEAQAEGLWLREGICRSVWLRGDRVVASVRIACPRAELLSYVRRSE